MSIRTDGPYGRVIRGLDDEYVQTRQRPCLRCRKRFDSVGPGNRLCTPCRAKSTDLSPFAI